MRLKHGLHLAYCTNVHPGEDWEEAFASLNRYTLAVRRRFAPEKPFAIGLRLSNAASLQLAAPDKFLEFQRWLERHNCYVFTINGFPYGCFHGTRVKEQVYLPDWADPRRLEYTNRLFDLLARLLPADVEGSVSTLPGSFKEFVRGSDQERLIRDNLWRCVEHIAQLSERSGRKLHLGVEPEPLGLFENTAETVRFFEQLRDEHPGDSRLAWHLGVNYDACHLAVEFEEPADAIARLQRHGVRLSKIHLSNALKLSPSRENRAALAQFAEEVYLHQVICRHDDGTLTRFKDLDLALAAAGRHDVPVGRGVPTAPLHEPSRTESGRLPSPALSSKNGGEGVAPHVSGVHCAKQVSGLSLPIPTAPAQTPSAANGRHETNAEWRVHFHIPLHSEPAAGGFGSTADHITGLLRLLKAQPGICSHLEMETYTWAVLPEPMKTRDVCEQIADEYRWMLTRLSEHGLAP